MDAAIVADARTNLLEDMGRDPEGHFHGHISGDRRLPPWFGSDEDSLPPTDYQERLYAFIRDRCIGQPPGEFDIRHNWYDQQMEFSRWIPDWEVQDHDEKIALVTWSPLTLQAWPDTQGWFPGGEALLDYIWECFMTNDAGMRRQKRKRAELEEAKFHVAQMSSLVSQGVATDAQLEKYDHYLQLADPDGWQEYHELAAEMRKPMLKMMDEFGI